MAEDLTDTGDPGEPGGSAADEASKGEEVATRDASPLGLGTLLALLVWGIAVLAVTGGIAGSTPLWFLVPIVGVAAPVALLALRNRGVHPELGVRDRAAEGERELLGALRERGSLTPAAAAMLTSLTVAEATGILERLARKGHLEARAQDGSLAYALREGDRRALEGPPREPVEPAPEAPPAALESGPLEPLSEREREVLGLLASGRTNREIAQELFVAVGTVKAHVNNVYRKLGAHNRAEAVSRARDLGLLG